MKINDFVVANTARTYLGLNPRIQATGSVTATGQSGLEKADKRIQAQVDVTSAQLSSFGKLKSSVSEAQTASRALSRLSQTSTASTQKAAAEKFVSAFNAAIASAKTTAGVVGDTGASRSANRVAKDLTAAVSTNSATIDSLKKAGFDLQSDGTLRLDVKKFESAQATDANSVRDTLAKVGQQVDKATNDELASGGKVTTSVTALTQRSAVLKSQQNALASLQQTSNSYVNNSYETYGGFRLFGL